MYSKETIAIAALLSKEKLFRDSLRQQLDIDAVHQFAPISDGWTDQRDEDSSDQEYCDRAGERNDAK
jgi:hypothetical protein